LKQQQTENQNKLQRIRRDFQIIRAEVEQSKLRFDTVKRSFPDLLNCLELWNATSDNDMLYHNIFFEEFAKTTNAPVIVLFKIFISGKLSFLQSNTDFFNIF